MRSVSLRLDDLRLVTIYLGFAGENEHTTVFFDCKKVFDQYPNAVPALTVKPPKGEPYPSVVTREEDIVSWTVTASDLIEDGDGEIQLSFVENGVVMKSYTSATKIYRSIVPTGDIPTPVEDWIIRAQEILGSVPNIIADALQEAKDSGEFDGVGITNIEKTATEGLIDTYTITLTDGSVKQFTVTNGYSPIATVSKQGKETTLSVTDANGTTSATILDGESNYDLLTNRPKINNVELVGNKTTEDLGLPTKVSDLQNDSGFLTEETDPTVPAWAKQSTKPTYTAQEVGALPADTSIPSKISDLTNDSGYLTTEADPTVPNWAKAPQKPTYTANEVGALPDNTFIPSRVSDLTDDSGHYTKPAGGIPASDLANGVLDVWSGLTYHRSTMSTDSDSFVLGGATDSPTEINKCTVTSTPTPNIIPKFDYQGRLHSVTPEDEWDGSNAVATTQYVDTMISNNTPDVPTAVSELDNDAGYLVATDIAGKANSADLATVATSGSYNDLSNKPVIPNPTSIIDDTAGDGDSNKVWSADKIADEVADLNDKIVMAGSAKVSTFALNNVTNTSGSYSHTTSIQAVTATMKPLGLEMSNPAAFLDDITITCDNGSITLTCPNVSGSSTVSVIVEEQAQASGSVVITSEEFAILNNKVGNLSNLQTETKSDLVSAVNENTQTMSSLLTEINSKADEPTGTKSAGKVYGLDSNLNPAWVNGGGGSGAVIDDTAGAGDTAKVWSADKTVREIQEIIISGGVPIDDTAGQGDIDKLWSADKVATILDYERTFVPSKNLNVTPYMSKTDHGVTYTVNADNSVSLSGTGTGGSYLMPSSSQDSAFRWKLPAGSYILTGGISVTRPAVIALYESQNTSTLFTSYQDNGAGKTFTTDRELWAVVRFSVADKNDTTGITIKLQVESGSTAHQYESPWGSYAESSRLDDIENSIDDLHDADNALAGRLTTAESDIEVAETDIISVNKDRIYNKTGFSRTGNLVQFYPVDGSDVNMRIDFESVDGFDSIRFVHCGENLIDMNAVVNDGTTQTYHGITYTKLNGYIHAEGTEDTYSSSSALYGYLSTGDWWLPKGHYAIGYGLGFAAQYVDGTSLILQREFVATEVWQALQFYGTTRGGNRVNFDYPLMLVAGDESPRFYKAFEGEKVVVPLPTTVYGGWIDINNSVLHITKTVEGGQLVPVTETTVDLDPITISKIVGINTLYSVDGIVKATGTAQLKYEKDYQMPVADFFLNNDYLLTKMERIRELMYGTAGTGDAFFFITDIHNEVNRLLSFPVIREIGKYCKIPRLFCGGDVADGLYNRMMEVYDLLEHCYKGEIHYTMGNHEWMSHTTGDELAFWSDMGKKDQIGNTDRHYYYVDNPQQKIRYVVMSSCAEDENGDSWDWGYEQAQRDWIQNVALDVESGWGIILFTHIAYMIDWQTGEKLTEPKFTPVETILNNYAGNGEIIAVIAGHAHCDGVFHTSAGIPIIVTTCDKGQAYLSRTTGDADMDSSIRIINTPSEQAFDVVVLDRENKEIHMVRIGCPAWNNTDGVIDQNDPYLEERVISYDRTGT